MLFAKWVLPHLIILVNAIIYDQTHTQSHAHTSKARCEYIYIITYTSCKFDTINNMKLLHNITTQCISDAKSFLTPEDPVTRHPVEDPHPSVYTVQV